MTLRAKLLLVVIALTLLVFCVLLMTNLPIDFVESGDIEPIETESGLALPGGELQINQEEGEQRNQQEERAVGGFYKILGPRKVPMDIPERIVFERINKGVSEMEMETNVVRLNEEIPTIEAAFKRMIGTMSFNGGIFPEWGVDHGDYFVFSGQPNMRKELAFKYGYAVKKENGRLYRWWFSQEELDEAITADEDGR